jgi:hypothetical protein
MNHRTLLRRAAALGTVAALAVAPLLATPGAAHATPQRPSAQAAPSFPAPTHGATVDWFDAKFPALDKGSVFETVTFERFEYLLKKNTGKWAFVIGGPEDPELQQTIGHIEKVAEAQGIERIYNFDPNLDGDDLSVFDLTGYDLDSADNAGKDQFLDLGERLVTSYLGKDAETPFTLANDPAKPDQRVAPQHPYLFVYDAAGGDNARIVDALTTAPDLSTPEAVTAYENDVKRVLTSAPLDVDTQWDFLSTEHNRRHYERYVKNADPAVETANRARFGGDIFNAAEDLTNGDENDFRIENITYPELLNILDSDGEFVILFGGTWCHNTAAIIKQTADYARRYGIKKVYNFDFSLDSTGNSGSLDKHIRDNSFRTVGGVSRKTRPAFLYGRILDKLSNAKTQYRITADEPGTQSTSPVRYDVGGTEKLARKIQVGHLLAYDKDATEDGKPAPVRDQAIRSDWTNPDGSVFSGNVEYMSEVWFTQGKDATYDGADPDRLRGNVNVTTEVGQNSLQNQRNFAKEAIDQIRDVIVGVAGGYDSSVSVTGAPASVSVESPGRLTAQVTVDTDFTGFFSDRTAGATLAPLTGNRPLGGSVQVLLDGAKIGEADVRADRTAAVDLALPTLTAGDHTLRYEYGGGAAGRVDAASTEQALKVVAKTSTTTLGEPPALTYGKSGTITATVSAGATGEVSLAGLPGGAITAPIQDGTATFTVPGTVPAGSYALTASYAGDAAFGSSTSAPVQLTVGKALTISSAASVTTAYGTAGTLKVTVSSPGGPAPTGSVTLTGVGAAQTKPVTAGVATFSLPRTLAAQRYTAKLVFDGGPDRAGSQTQVSYTVTAIAPSKVALAVTRKPTSKKAGAGRVTITVPSGLAAATGTVKVTLKKGGSTKTVTGTLSRGSVAVVLPKLAKGTWKVGVTYAGAGSYRAAASATTSLKVTK